jgi:hypothetical protein
VRIGAALVLLVVLAVGAPKLFEPATWALLDAVRQLGPISGWHCVESATYIYDPTRESADATLVSDPPEALVLQQVQDRELDYVEIDLRGGDSLVWTHAAAAQNGSDDRRVYVMSPGVLQPITVDAAGRPRTICNSHLGDWRIVEEHAF